MLKAPPGNASLCTDEGGSAVSDKSVIEAFFPSVGWTDNHDVPPDMEGATILFVGSMPDTAELIIDYQPKSGAAKRLVLGFTERGMWPQSICDLHLSNQDVS